MFDKQIYWQNRKDKKRGQGEKPKGKLYPKGEQVLTGKVVYVEGDTRLDEYANDLGSHMIKVGRGFNTVNRIEARKFENAKDRAASHKNYAHQHEKNGFRHVVNTPDSKPAYPPSLTNHLRHRQQQIGRTKQQPMV